jgi:hypothetical protein
MLSLCPPCTSHWHPLRITDRDRKHLFRRSLGRLLGRLLGRFLGRLGHTDTTYGDYPRAPVPGIATHTLITRTCGYAGTVGSAGGARARWPRPGAHPRRGKPIPEQSRTSPGPAPVQWRRIPHHGAGGEPSPNADVGSAQPRRRCGKPSIASPGADVDGAGPMNAKPQIIMQHCNMVHLRRPCTSHPLRITDRDRKHLLSRLLGRLLGRFLGRLGHTDTTYGVIRRLPACARARDCHAHIDHTHLRVRGHGGQCRWCKGKVAQARCTSAPGKAHSGAESDESRSK